MFKLNGQTKIRNRKREDVHSLVGVTAEVLGTEAGQEVFGYRFQQRFHLNLQPHVDQILVLIRVFSEI